MNRNYIIDDVAQTIALATLQGKPLSPSLAHKRLAYAHEPRVGQDRKVRPHVQLDDRTVARLVDHRGGGRELVVDLEGLDERTVLVARMLIDGEKAGEIQRALDMGRKEFEARREELRRLFA